MTVVARTPDVRRRVAMLEHELGHSADPDNPLGRDAVTACDDNAELVPQMRDTLVHLGIGADLVPRSAGGRLDGLDGLVRILRCVGRRDPAASLALGVTPFMAWANVWVGGDLRQQADIGARLVAGERVACAYHELAHGNDLSANAFRARSCDDGWMLSGRKEVISNADTCTAAVIFARTGEHRGPRSHSLFLVDEDVLNDPRASVLPRYRTAGMRGVSLTGWELDDCPTPVDSLLGEPGRAIDVALRCFQLSRIVLPGATIGLLDTMLRLAVHSMRSRRLYGKTGLDIPMNRDVLAGAFLDLLMADAYVRAAARAASLVPEQLGPLSSGVKALVPEVVVAAVDRLAILMGSQFFLRDGVGAMAQKLVRDAQPTSFGHASQITCLTSLLPHLARCSRSAQSWQTPPAEVFGRSPVAPVAVDQLCLAAPAGDMLAGRAGAEQVAAWDRRLSDLRAGIIARGPAGTRVDAIPAAVDAAHAWTCAQAAGACLGLHDAGLGPLAGALVLEAALTRLAQRAGRQDAPLRPEVREVLLDLLLARTDAGLAYDLDSDPTNA